MNSAVTNLWRQFVQRRLWPVAILLVAALAAVPLTLAKDPAPVPPAPPTPAESADDGAGELAAQPIVAPSQPGTKRRHVLGNAKNPFGVVKQESPSATDSPDVTVQETGDGSQTDGSQTGGSSPSTGGGSAPTPTTGAPTTPSTPSTPTPKPKEYEPEELTVRFGDGDGMTRRSVQKLEPLPSAELPAVIYMGVLKDGKTAVFLLEAGVTPDGDGECRPTPEQCETIRLRVGETEFFDVTDEAGAVKEQFQLDLLKIHNVKRSASPSRTMSAGVKSGPRRSELRSTVGRVSAYVP
jgi:hypothetical protein